VLPAGAAEDAPAAGDDRTDDDAIARREVVDVRANGADNARHLVARDDARLSVLLALVDANVRVADRCGGNVDNELAWAGGYTGNVLHGDPAGLVEDKRFHAAPRLGALSELALR
jgi:hypothetical protein